MTHRIVIVGRSRKADIRLTDGSVSRLHAEFVLSSNGVFHIADRASANGTWVEAGGRWERVRQRTVVAADRLRFGRVGLTVSELLSRVPTPSGGKTGGRTRGKKNVRGSARVSAGRTPGTPGTPDTELPRGRVRRNPLTGEVVED